MTDLQKLETMYEPWEIIRIYGECEYREVVLNLSEELAKASTPEQKQQVLGMFRDRMIIYRKEPILTPYIKTRHHFVDEYEVYQNGEIV